MAALREQLAILKIERAVLTYRNVNGPEHNQLHGEITFWWSAAAKQLGDRPDDCRALDLAEQEHQKRYPRCTFVPKFGGE